MKTIRPILCAYTVACATILGVPAHAATVDLGFTGGGQEFSTEQPTVKLTPLIQTSGNFNDFGMVRWFAGNFVPRGFERAAGQLLDIASNTALFAQIGTTYGGNGQTNFALPDLIDRTAVGTGGRFSLGQRVGSETVTLNTGNLPSHNHSTATGPSSDTGAGDTYNNMMPGLALDFELVRQGLFPSRNGGSSTAPEDTLGFVTIDAANDGDSLTGNDKDEAYGTADGELIPIQQNAALFALLGNTYGGDGQSNFAEPDMRDRIVTGTGEGPGLTNRQLGSTRGSNEEMLSVAEMPAHTHTDPDGGDSGTTGGGMAENNLQEEVTLRWLIALEGVFPARGPGGVGNFGEPFLGEIALFAGNFAPTGWAFADGQLLQIDNNDALFAILGTQFGGDGRTDFALPDLRGRTPLGGNVNEIGQQFGTEAFFLTENNLPSHTHTVDRTIGGEIPLPASLWMLLAALGGLGVAGRCRS